MNNCNHGEETFFIKRPKINAEEIKCPDCGKVLGWNGKISDEQPCLWDSMPETFPGSGIKMGALSCPCPKCSPRC